MEPPSHLPHRHVKKQHREIKVRLVVSGMTVSTRTAQIVLSKALTASTQGHNIVSMYEFEDLLVSCLGNRCFYAFQT